MNEFVYSVLNQNEISIRIVSAEMPWQLMVAVNFSDVRELITSTVSYTHLDVYKRQDPITDVNADVRHTGGVIRPDEKDKITGLCIRR